MSWRSLLVRFVCNGILAAWVGGFSFYGGVVIPTLHDRIGVPETAGTTRIVTHWLNGLGGVALLFWVGIRLVRAAGGIVPGAAPPRIAPRGARSSCSSAWSIFIIGWIGSSIPAGASPSTDSIAST